MNINTDTTLEQRMKAFMDEFEALLRTYEIESAAFCAKKDGHTLSCMRIGHPVDFMLLKDEFLDKHKEAFIEAGVQNIKIDAKTAIDIMEAILRDKKGNNDT